MDDAEVKEVEDSSYKPNEDFQISKIMLNYIVMRLIEGDSNGI